MRSLPVAILIASVSAASAADYNYRTPLAPGEIEVYPPLPYGLLIVPAPPRYFPPQPVIIVTPPPAPPPAPLPVLMPPPNPLPPPGPVPPPEEYTAAPAQPARPPCAAAVVDGLRAGPHGIEGLALREGPGVQFPIITHLFNGHPLTVCDREGRWFGVTDPTGLRGWSHMHWIRPAQGGVS